MLDMCVYNPLRMKSFHVVWARNMQECSLKSSIGKARQLLKALRGTDAEPEPLPEWYDSRQKALREAKRFQRGQAPEDLCEIFTDYQDNAVPEEDRITTLRREISEVFPNSPWADRETLETAIAQTRE